MSVYFGIQWHSQRGARGQWGPQTWKTIRMVGNGGPITGCLIHRVKKYSWFQDACVRFSFPDLPIRKNKIIIQIGLSKEFSTSVGNCSIIVDRAMKMSIFLMCMMDTGY